MQAQQLRLQQQLQHLVHDLVDALVGVTITSPMPGKILGIKAAAGTAVKRGQVILLLEAMKMENEIVAPQDGTVASVNVAVGDMVEPGAVLATLN